MNRVICRWRLLDPQRFMHEDSQTLCNNSDNQSVRSIAGFRTDVALFRDHWQE